WTVDMRRIPGNEHAPNAHLLDVPVMDPEVAAPLKRTSLNSARTALFQQPSHELQRWLISFRLVNHGYYAPAAFAHGKDCQRARFARTKLHFIGRQAAAYFNVGQKKRLRVCASLERQIQEMPHRAVRPVAADNERSCQLKLLAMALQRNANVTFML